MRELRTIFWLGFTGVVFITGCSRQETAHKSVSLMLGGREIKATIEVPAGAYPDIDPATILAKGGTMDGPIAICPDGGAASVRFGPHQIRVEEERLVLDGEESAKMAAAVRRVELWLSDTKLTVRADGATILATNVQR
ncbi:MAG TPA: hypothetical protein VG167_20250 [Verrucomicrobiae bacterium]|nr:hypothetical protein [Verrucomicrobiae bacterium]